MLLIYLRAFAYHRRHHTPISSSCTQSLAPAISSRQCFPFSIIDSGKEPFVTPPPGVPLVPPRSLRQWALRLPFPLSSFPHFPPFPFPFLSLIRGKSFSLPLPPLSFPSFSAPLSFLTDSGKVWFVNLASPSVFSRFYNFLLFLLSSFPYSSPLRHPLHFSLCFLSLFSFSLLFPSFIPSFFP